MQAFAARLAEQGVQVILMEPQGHSRRLFALSEGLATYHQIAYGQITYNPLEAFFDEPSTQYDHVTTVFQLLLKRDFNNFERAAIRIGLQKIYSHFDAGELLTHPALTPTLDYFCQTLGSLAAEGDESQLGDAFGQISAEIQALFVQSDFATTFNAPTNIDLKLQSRLNLFDFSGVPRALRGLFYYLTTLFCSIFTTGVHLVSSSSETL